MKKFICFALLCILPLLPCRLEAQQQFLDSAGISFRTSYQLASNDWQPLWLVSRHFGAYTNRQFDQTSRLTFANQHQFNEKWNIAYEAELINNDQYTQTYLQQAYLKVKRANWQLHAGRFEYITGVTIPELSSGSLGVSGNALPIPQVTISTDDFIQPAFMPDWFSFSANWAHGWLGEGRAVNNAWLHQKGLYLKLGPEKFYFTAGLQHFGIWGGVHPQGELPSRFKDYLRIFVGAPQSKDTTDFSGPLNLLNALGSHILIPEFSLNGKTENLNWSLYTQNIFDKGIGRPDGRDQIAGFRILSRDRLVGIHVEFKETSLQPEFVLERIYTKYQGGAIIFVGQDNYYNNAVYGTGWNYKNRIIGTPLFINRSRAREYFEDEEIRAWETVSNRIAGWHLGLGFQFIKKLQTQTLITYVKHFGAYSTDESLFSPPLQQWHLGQSIYYTHNKQLTGTLEIGLDDGMLGRSAGVRLGLQYRLSDFQ